MEMWLARADYFLPMPVRTLRRSKTVVLFQIVHLSKKILPLKGAIVHTIGYYTSSAG